MKEGTITVLFGAHNIFHSIIVLISWIRIYKKFPSFWQLFCIFIHDIGYFGKDYLTNLSNDDHEILGATIAKRLFGQKGYDFVFGHRSNNNVYSLLERADDFSQVITPIWLMKLNYLIENKKLSDPFKWKFAMEEAWNNRVEGQSIKGFEIYKKLKGD